LTGLGCWSNQLTSLDASGCTSLTALECSNNQLTSLNVSNCTELIDLCCDHNQLTDENLPALYGFPIQPRYIHFNTICDNYFDLRGNKGFTEQAIRQLADNLPNISYEQILYDKLPED